MCQSKANGGRRCDGSLSGNSNYPDAIRFDKRKKEWVVNEKEFVSSGTHVLHAAIVSARSHNRLPSNIAAIAADNSSLWNDMTPKERWGFWSDVSNLDNPSDALENLHAMGWEGNFPALAEIRNVPQSHSWHPEGAVHVHIQQAGNVAARNASKEGLGTKERQIAVLGAICHDFGKSTHTRTEADGSITSRGHAEAGVPVARRFLTEINAPKEVQRVVPALVNEHMCHANSNPSRKAVTNLVSRLEKDGATLEQWARVANADTGGRGEASQQGVGGLWLDIHRKHLEETAVEERSAGYDGRFLRSIDVPQGPAYKELMEAWKAQGNEFEPVSAEKWTREFLANRA